MPTLAPSDCSTLRPSIRACLRIRKGSPTTGGTSREPKSASGFPFPGEAAHSFRSCARCDPVPPRCRSYAARAPLASRRALCARIAEMCGSSAEFAASFTQRRTEVGQSSAKVQRRSTEVGATIRSNLLGTGCESQTRRTSGGQSWAELGQRSGPTSAEIGLGLVKVGPSVDELAQALLEHGQVGRREAARARRRIGTVTSAEDAQRCAACFASCRARRCPGRRTTRRAPRRRSTSRNSGTRSATWTPAASSRAWRRSTATSPRRRRAGARAGAQRGSVRTFVPKWALGVRIWTGIGAVGAFCFPSPSPESSPRSDVRTTLAPDSGPLPPNRPP